MEDVSVLIEKAQSGDGRARDILIEENLGLVHHIVKRYAGHGYDMEDLFQTGTIGLMKAIDHFDLKYDVKFSTYAVPLIAGEIRRFLRDDGPVKVSRSLKDAAYKLHRAKEALLQEQGYEPTLQQLCERSGVSYDDAVMAIGAAGEVESIYKPVYEGDGKQIRLLDQLPQNGEEGQWEDREKNRLIDQMLLSQLISELPGKERRLIRMRYFEERTQTEVARELGISQVQVSRMEKKILIRMRDRVTQKE